MQTFSFVSVEKHGSISRVSENQQSNSALCSSCRQNRECVVLSHCSIAEKGTSFFLIRPIKFFVCSAVVVAVSVMETPKLPVTEI